MRKRGLVAICLLPLACTTPVTPGPIEPHVAWLRGSIDGDLTASQPGVPPSGTKNDLRSDFGLDQDDTFDLGVAYRLGLHRIGVDVLPLDFDATTTLDRTVTYKGTNFPAGDKVETDVRLSTWRLQWDYPLLSAPGGEWHAGAGACWWWFASKIRDQAESESHDSTVLLPQFGTSGRLDLPENFGLEGAATFALRNGGTSIVDLQASVRYRFIDFAWATLGWRWLHYDFKDNTVNASFTVNGPQLAVWFRL